MEKIYSEYPKKYGLTKASSETVQYLLDFSKSLHIVRHAELTFESSLN
ncbi:MAG: hypothetical protein ACR2MT_12330 [Aurantibacter sp.]